MDAIRRLVFISRAKSSPSILLRGSAPQHDLAQRQIEGTLAPRNFLRLAFAQFDAGRNFRP